MKEEIEFISAKKRLFGDLYIAKTDEQAALLIIAGGGNVPRAEGWYPELQEALAEKGITSFAFDFTGVGQSEGVFSETSLITRINDAQVALSLLQENCKSKNIYVMGVSMGAPIAISLSLQNTLTSLILLVPAAYSLEARTKTFGPEFSVEIRKGWDNSPEFNNLSQFEGKIFLAYGSHDEVVPREIYEKYGTLVSDKANIYEFESIGHKFMRETDLVSQNARRGLISRLPTFILE